jgi:hypothetical protein
MRQTAVASILLIAAFLLPGCQPRLPLTRPEVASAAQNWCIREGMAWGDPVDVLKAAESDEHGRAWWTVRYAAPDGEKRIVLVDAENGWAKRP